MLDVQVLQLDELYLGAHLLGPHQGLDNKAVSTQEEQQKAAEAAKLKKEAEDAI